MKKDIILAGVGGQGILSIAAVIGLAALENNLFFKQSEVHGMSQRGGDVYSHFRLSDKAVLSDLIPYGSADMIISVEPMESLRYLPWLSPSGWLIASSDPYINITDYPPLEEILYEIRKIKNHLIIDAETTAREAGSVKAVNMVMLGAASHFTGLEFSSLENGIRTLFSTKGEKITEINLKAFRAGRNIINP
jgi:indolepyruvate ferredoxin oxidoreductase beta subunit